MDLYLQDSLLKDKSESLILQSFNRPPKLNVKLRKEKFILEMETKINTV